MEKNATDEQAAEAEEADLGAQLRSAVGRLYRRFRSERPEGGLGDAALLEELGRLFHRFPEGRVLLRVAGAEADGDRVVHGFASALP